MPEQVLNKIGEPSVTVAAASANSFAEEELVAAAKSGDEGAFEILFKCHQRRIFLVAFRYTRVREDAEDVVQQTFVKAFVHLQRFEGKSSLSTWLTRIAVNQALMLLRSRRGLRQVLIDDSSSHEETTPALEVADPGPDPETAYVQKEEAQLLSAAMCRLGPGLRKAIELRDLRELSNLETAARLGVSLGAVKARVFHARRKLGKTLRRYVRSRRICESDIRVSAGNANRKKSYDVQRVRRKSHVLDS
jgi:RNA polymerase sigma-70 factor, ECF subfamily